MSKYRNKAEERFAATLTEEWQYEAQRLPYKLDHKYLPDFIDVEGKRIIEFKGRFTASDRQKMKAVRAQYPDWEITMVFQRPHTKIAKNSATTYSDWCDRNNISWRSA